MTKAGSTKRTTDQELDSELVMSLRHPIGSQDVVRQLLSACEEGNVSVVQGLLDQGVDVDVGDDNEVTPLQVGASVATINPSANTYPYF